MKRGLVIPCTAKQFKKNGFFLISAVKERDLDEEFGTEPAGTSCATWSM